MSLFEITPYLGYVEDTSLNNFCSKLQLGVPFFHTKIYILSYHTKVYVTYRSLYMHTVQHCILPMGKPAFCKGVFHAESNKTPSCNLQEELFNDVSLTYAKKGAVSNIDIEFWGVNIGQNCTIRILNSLYLGYYLSKLFFIVQVDSSTLYLWLTGILIKKILFVLEFGPPKLGSRWTKLHF